MRKSRPYPPGNLLINLARNKKIILRFTNEETANIRVSENTEEAAKKILSEKGLVELTILVGYYMGWPTASSKH